MKILDIYISRCFLKYFLIVIAVPAILFSFFEFMAQLESVGHGTYSVGDAVVYVTQTLPGRLADLLPMAVLLTGIISLGSLADSHELLAMEASGISTLRISAPVMFTCLALMLISSIAGESLIPVLEKRAREMRFQKLSDRTVTPVSHGFWARFGKAFIHVESVEGDGTVSGIEIFEFDDSGRLSRVTSAREAVIVGTQWIMHGVTSTSMVTMEGEKLPTMTLNGFLDPEQVNALEFAPTSFSVPELLEYIRALEKSGQNPGHYALALWKKLATPLSTAAMALLSLTFIFGSVRELGAGWRIVTGAIAGLLLYFGQQLTVNVGTYLAIPTFVSVMLPVAVVWGIAVLRWRKVMREI